MGATPLYSSAGLGTPLAQNELVKLALRNSVAIIDSKGHSGEDRIMPPYFKDGRGILHQK